MDATLSHCYDIDGDAILFSRIELALVPLYRLLFNWERSRLISRSLFFNSLS